MRNFILNMNVIFALAVHSTHSADADNLLLCLLERDNLTSF